MKSRIMLAGVGAILSLAIGSLTIVHHIHHQAAIAEAVARVERCEQAARANHIPHQACMFDREQLIQLQNGF